MASAKNGRTILLAEDEDALRAFVLNILEGCGYRVLVAPNGAAALEVAKGFGGTIHLLLSDIEMPAMTGIELASQLQRQRPEVRVLLMSGMSTGRLLLNEDWQFLPKPFIINMLKSRVRHILSDGPIIRPS